MTNGKKFKLAEPQEECEYCNKPLIEGCNEFGSIFDHDSDIEHPCPNNENQFPPREISGNGS